MNKTITSIATLVMAIGLSSTNVSAEENCFGCHPEHVKFNHKLSENYDYITLPESMPLVDNKIGCVTCHVPHEVITNLDYAINTVTNTIDSQYNSFIDNNGTTVFELPTTLVSPTLDTSNDTLVSLTSGDINTPLTLPIFSDYLIMEKTKLCQICHVGY